MARPIIVRKVKNWLGYKPVEGQTSSDGKPIMLFTKPEGEDHVTPLSAMGADKSPFVQNLRVALGGRYVTRDGTNYIGPAAATAICGACVFVASTVLNYITRVTTTGVEVYTGSLWRPLVIGAAKYELTSETSSPILSELGDYIVDEDIIGNLALAIDPDTPVEFSVWNKTLMFTDGTSGLYEIDYNEGTYTLIPAAPIGLHLTTFDGRAILSNLSPIGLASRIQWSVKYDNHDWTGLGSGYEDLLSSPGGVVDTQHGIIPVSDSEAFIVRQGSMWLMNTTGVFDAPFIFTEHFDQGTASPDTCIRIPGEKISQQTLRTLFAQIICLGNDDVVMMKMEGVFPLGFPIRDQLLNSILNVGAASADFEPRLREYRIFIPNWTQPQTTSVVWRYNIDTHLWTHDLFPFCIKSLFCKDILPPTLAIEDLPGIISALTGTIGLLGVTLGSANPGAIFITKNGDYLVKEDSNYSTDNPNSSTTVGIPIELRTGLLAVPTPLTRSLLSAVELEYEAAVAVTVGVDYSVDGGSTWTSYGTLNLGVTTTPTVVVYRYTREARQIMIRVISTSGGGLKLHSLVPSLTLGASINP